MINHKPALICPYGRRASTEPCAVKKAFACRCHTLVPAPVYAVRTLGYPHVVAAQLRTARAVERIVSAVYLFLKQRAVLVVRGEYHAFMGEVVEITGVHHSHSHRYRRHLREGEVISVVHCGYAAVLNTERLIKASAENRRIFTVFIKTDTVVAEHDTEVGKRREIVLSLVVYHARIGEVDIRTVPVELKHFESVVLIHRETYFPFFLLRSFSHTDNHTYPSVHDEDTGVE